MPDCWRQSSLRPAGSRRPDGQVWQCKDFSTADPHAVPQLKGGLEQGGEKVPGLELIGRWDKGLNVVRDGGSPQPLYTPNPKPANPTRCDRVSSVLCPGHAARRLRIVCACKAPLADESSAACQPQLASS